MAVLPTPGSPMRTGLFFWRRDEDLHDPLDLRLAADDRVELALLGLLREVAAELVEELRGLRLLARGPAAAPAWRRPGPESMRMISLRIFSASASKSSRIRAATPSFSRTRPSRMCSVPM